MHGAAPAQVMQSRWTGGIHAHVSVSGQRYEALALGLRARPDTFVRRTSTPIRVGLRSATAKEVRARVMGIYSLMVRWLLVGRKRRKRSTCMR